MATISVNIPEEIAGYADDLQFFVQVMVRKLHTNRHKGTNMNMSPLACLEGAQREIEEATEALRGEGQFEFMVECADVSNMAFLAAMCAVGMTRSEYEDNHRSGKESPIRICRPTNEFWSDVS